MQSQSHLHRHHAGRISSALLIVIAVVSIVEIALLFRNWESEPPRSDGDTKVAISPPSASRDEGTLPTDINNSWDTIDDPSADGWDTERFNELAGGQLKELAAIISGSGGKITKEMLAPIVSPDIRSTALIPPETENTYHGKNLKVQRATGPASELSVEGLDSFVTALSAYASKAEARMKFKIVNVTQGKEFVTTRQIVEFVAFEKDGITERHSTWKITWLPASPPVIATIELESFEQAERDSPQTLFEDVTTSAIGDLECYPTQLALGANHWLGRSQDSEANSQMGVPGIAIADVNGDGLDDLYLCQNGGLPNRLLLQSPDGTLREEAAAWGVDWLDASRGVLLIDLDNDGDKDLVVATIGNLVLAENIEGKRFQIRGALPVGDDTTSLAAADFDRDGKLDIYSCIYRHDQLAEGDASELVVTSGATFVQHDATNGGANSLFRNLGDFNFSNITKEIGLNQNNTRYSFAATWEDLDNDGDLDLYVANDYGRNNIYRNDREDGFKDIATGTSAEDSAFGMGVTVGDYDRDGWMDFYVSNMWSSAGQRVTSQEKFKPGAPEVKERLQRFAQGNSLLRNLGRGEFEAVPYAAGAAIGRWAWGSQFVDFNNDGWQDLVVANGFMSAGGDGDL